MIDILNGTYDLILFAWCDRLRSEKTISVTAIDGSNNLGFPELLLRQLPNGRAPTRLVLPCAAPARKPDCRRPYPVVIRFAYKAIYSPIRISVAHCVVDEGLRQGDAARLGPNQVIAEERESFGRERKNPRGVYVERFHQS